MTTCLFCAVLLFSSTSGNAQEPVNPSVRLEVGPAAPVLSDGQKQSLQAVLQALQIASLKQQLAAAQQQLAARDIEAARSMLTQLLSALQVAGYTLDLNEFTYAPITKTPPAAGQAEEVQK